MALFGRSVSRWYVHGRSRLPDLRSRNITTGLLLIPAKPLVEHPFAPSVLAISQLAMDCDSQLHTYSAIHKTKLDSKRGVAMALVHDVEKARQAISAHLTPLPTVIGSLDEIPEPEVLDYELPEPDDDLIELPPHLQPQQMDDGIPYGDPEDAIQDTDWATPDVLADLKQCPDFDPNIDPSDVEDYDAESLKRSLDDYDAVDMKNCDNWTSRIDPEAPFFTRDDYGWLKADMDECSKGALPKLYEPLDVPNKTVREVIVSDDYEPSPLSCT